MKQYYLAFHLLASYTNARFLKILKGCMGDLIYAWKRAGKKEFMNWGLEEQVAAKILHEKKSIDPETEWHRLQQKDIAMLIISDKEYPVLLKEISDPPVMLYVMGALDNLSTTAVAFVGTRLMTTYGKQVLEHLIAPLMQAGVVIVSGLAVGVDSYAHQVTLDSKGKTIAVLGSGIDTIYPVNNRRLAREIVENSGSIVSEFPPGMKPTPYTFPIRNRIISGLSKGVVIVEAKEKSGSLITARLALEQNRDVFAVPGGIFFSNSEGTHNLIKNGEAKLVTSGEDILLELGLKQHPHAAGEALQLLPFDNDNQEKLYLLLSKEPQLADDIIQQAGIASAEASSILTMLEMRGMVRNMGGNQWVRR